MGFQKLGLNSRILYHAWQVLGIMWFGHLTLSFAIQNSTKCKESRCITYMCRLNISYGYSIFMLNYQCVTAESVLIHDLFLSLRTCHLFLVNHRTNFSQLLGMEHFWVSDSHGRQISFSRGRIRNMKTNDILFAFSFIIQIKRVGSDFVYLKL